MIEAAEWGQRRLERITAAEARRAEQRRGQLTEEHTFQPKAPRAQSSSQPSKERRRSFASPTRSSLAKRPSAPHAAPSPAPQVALSPARAAEPTPGPSLAALAVATLGEACLPSPAGCEPSPERVDEVRKSSPPQEKRRSKPRPMIWPHPEEVPEAEEVWKSSSSSEGSPSVPTSPRKLRFQEPNSESQEFLSDNRREEFKAAFEPGRLHRGPTRFCWRELAPESESEGSDLDDLRFAGDRWT
ncbi:unnamed protein product [Effrenium voratum]|uniref:Uncharacterized protein n=1 Tax=Effrenium voratum TaxID=2562239 RepID=A0AA36IX15_9DINO|nr:unnamed protein product [Effrenium voratum]